MNVAVIDIGSNSIKVLVAHRAPNGAVLARHQRTIDARISAGISNAEPRLSEEGITRGLDAIRSLLADVTPFSPKHIVVVATSAVRDAQNGADFRRRVRAATGHEVRILTGDEEANLIGRGLASDPALLGLHNFYVFDLGGGSLECLAFRQRRLEQAVSLQLGCVRLTEKFVADINAEFDSASAAKTTAHVRETFARSTFAFNLPPDALAVGTGGTMTTVRAIDAARAGKPFETVEPRITTAQLRDFLAVLGGIPLAERKQIPGLPPARADVFPAALATFVTIAELGHFTAFRHSQYNLRFGIADDLLEVPPRSLSRAPFVTGSRPPQGGTRPPLSGPPRG